MFGGKIFLLVPGAFEATIQTPDKAPHKSL